MAKIKITLKKSLIGSSQRQKRTVAALGIKKTGDSVEKEVTPQIKGMVDKLNHLIVVEEVK